MGDDLLWATDFGERQSLVGDRHFCMSASKFLVGDDIWWATGSLLGASQICMSASKFCMSASKFWRAPDFI